MINKSTNVNALYEGIISGNRFQLSRALTLVESTKPTTKVQARELINKCWNLQKQAWRIGITGPPGVGKSSFIEKMGLAAIARGKTVAVLSIDPSSTISKGSILGDKTRMEHLSKNERAFIRPSPNRGILGGIEERTFEAIVLCEAAGYDFVIVETVGVGQSESKIRDLVDHLTVMVMPGSGDGIQGIKRGLLELANVILIHKADGHNLNAAASAVKDFKNTMQSTVNANHVNTVVMKASSLTSEGIDSFLDIVKIYFNKSNDIIKALRRKQHICLIEAYLQAFLYDYAKEKTQKYISSHEQDHGQFHRHSPINLAAKIFEELTIE